MKSTSGQHGASERVARALLEGGPQTAAALAERLGLTTTAIRRHLDSLVALGHVESGERAPYGPDASRAVTRGRGRPARVYSVTGAGRDAFESAYDDLAVGALRYLEQTGGPDAVADFARHRVAELERRYAAVGSHAPLDRPAALVEALSADGFAASVVESNAAGAVQICQHHCPVGHVAVEFPALCDAESEAFGRLLGTHVTRLATLANGDGVCTTLVPRPSPETDPRTTTRTTTRPAQEATR